MSVLQGRRELFSLALLFLANCANANATPDWNTSIKTLKHPEFSIAGGVDWYNTRDTHLIVSPFETDRNQVRQSSTQGSWKVGLGYSLFEDTLPHLKRLLLEINFYQTSTTLSGSVWQYEQSQFNNYHFKAPIKSNRVMLDLKPSFFTWRITEPYAILGLGATWNSVSYKETVTASDADPNSRLRLSKQTTSQLAWDLGVGWKVALTKNIDASLEYIYAILGHGSPVNDATGIALEKTPKFSLQNQSFLLGLNFRF